MREADAILRDLRDGNKQYVLTRSVARLGPAEEGVPVHRPRAVVVGCSDARVPVEQVFDQAPGSLFVIRVAGHVLEPATLASILYAVRELGVRLVIVLGHQACGAVRAALAASSDEMLRPLVGPIAARLSRATSVGAAEDEAITANAQAAMAEVGGFLRAGVPELAPLVSLYCAIKALDTGEVTWLD